MALECLASPTVRTAQGMLPFFTAVTNDGLSVYQPTAWTLFPQSGGYGNQRKLQAIQREK